MDLSIAEIKKHRHWTPEDAINLFRRELINGLIDPTLMTVEQAERYGTKLGHWGRVKLTDDEVQREGWDRRQGAA